METLLLKLSRRARLAVAWGLIAAALTYWVLHLALGLPQWALFPAILIASPSGAILGWEWRRRRRAHEPQERTDEAV